MNTGVCRSCGAKVLWVKTINGRPMALDAEPVDGGNLILNNGVCRTVPTPAEGNFTTYKSHFATCPGAASHRKKVKRS